MESLNSPDKELKPFWRKDGMDWIAELGQMKIAVVVAFYTPRGTIENHYAISPRSYFPFTNEQHNKKFDNYYECCIYAESIILDWINSLVLSDNGLDRKKKLYSKYIPIPKAVPIFKIDYEQYLKDKVG